MKNKNLFIPILIFFQIIFFEATTANEFVFQGKEILFFKNGNIIKGSGEINLEANNGITITGNKFEYNKLDSILTVKGNVFVKDYKNALVLKTEELNYIKSIEKIITIGNTEIEYNNEYFLSTKNIIYFKNLNKILSNNKVQINNQLKNFSTFSDFVFLINENLLKGNNIEYLDSSLNKIFLKKGILDLETKEIAGKDLLIEFDNGISNDSRNEPRLKGISFYSNNKKSEITKGVFTTCKKTDNCPPWELSSKKISHDKEKQRINYKNSWLKIYDIPILYFPKFFHPDPTVKRQSGFLTPSFINSNTTGSSLSLPYFSVISENKDITYKPRIISEQDVLLQTEYRQVEKNSEHIIDTSYFADNNKSNNFSSKSHIFANSKINLNLLDYNESNFEINIQKSSNDTYLKTHKLKSPLITSETALHSFLRFNGIKDDLEFSISTEVYEDLTRKPTDRYEFIYPNYEIIKKYYPDNFNYGSFSLRSHGYQKNTDTNIYERVLINDFSLNSSPLISKNGFSSKYTAIIKNVNTNSSNSIRYKNEPETEILTALLYEINYPLIKKMYKYDNTFTPTIAFRYSPNKSKNIINEDRRIDINNIFSMNRIGEEDTVEGGRSITIGSKFKKTDKLDNSIYTFDWATNIRDLKNYDLPTKSIIGEKNSDIVGNFSLKANKFIDLSYDFSYDNNLKHSNYDSINTELNVNNFFLNFEFSEERNSIGNTGYFSNKSGINIDKNNLISYSTRKNIQTDLTEYYNLIYEYKNDCLIASIQYNKEYYNDSDLKPETQLFFSITILPFGKVNSQNFN
ncbi:organic solvent tolerance protein [Candidatus Pelagibacter sp.]|nr:organic solvent tolerance protein [Candidatus Pelagibacter sp.]